MSRRDKYNAKAYDQTLIRFPKGTLKRFRELFGGDVSFNAWVSNLVTSRLLIKETLYPNNTLPDGEDPTAIDKKEET